MRPDTDQPDPDRTEGDRPEPEPVAQTDEPPHTPSAAEPPASDSADESKSESDAEAKSSEDAKPPPSERERVQQEVAKAQQQLEELNAKLQHLPSAEYPQMVYHPNGERRTVQSAEERQALGSDWQDSPPIGA
jgi:hypothetical protein